MYAEYQLYQWLVGVGLRGGGVCEDKTNGTHNPDALLSHC